MHNFEKLIFWQKSMDLAKEIYIICSKMPSDEKFGLSSQMKRCAVSIPSNIAEGSGRNSNKEFSRFLSIALGSAFELHTQLILSKELKIIENSESKIVIENLIEVQKMIYGFIKKLEQEGLAS